MGNRTNEAGSAVIDSVPVETAAFLLMPHMIVRGGIVRGVLEP